MNKPSNQKIIQVAHILWYNCVYTLSFGDYDAHKNNLL